MVLMCVFVGCKSYTYSVLAKEDGVFIQQPEEDEDFDPVMRGEETKNDNNFQV